MGLFNFHFDRPGPGVSPDAPRKKGPARFFEILGRDLMSFYLAGLLALVSALPFVFGVWFAVDTHSLVPLLLDRRAPAVRPAGYHPAQPARRAGLLVGYLPPRLET